MSSTAGDPKFYGLMTDPNQGVFDDSESKEFECENNVNFEPLDMTDTELDFFNDKECVVCKDEFDNFLDELMNMTSKENLFANKIDDIFEPIKKLLILKNTNYGSSFDKLRDEYGAVSFLIRLKDKLYRYETLATQNIECNEEGLDDTLKDIIGYVTLELIYRSNSN